MSRKYMITGGASSGKSEWAAAFFGDDPKCKNLTYISTSDEVSPVISKLMKKYDDNGTKTRIVFQKREPAAEIDPSCESAFYIFDNIPEMVTDILFSGEIDPDHITDEQIDRMAQYALDAITKALAKIDQCSSNIILVSLETGFSLRSHLRAERAFGNILCEVNKFIARVCDEVYLSLSGIHMKIK